ncbi:MAG: DASS family sodium-coupled anion symporter [Sporomusaceae bacterium]|nr:DASS family sodium-coupled anion symporter [Sporomusaceae bacterium]
MSTGEKGKLDELRQKIGVPLAILCTVIVWLLPGFEGLSQVGHRALALFAGIFILYLTEALPLPVTSILVVPSAVLMGIVNLKGALEGFASSSVYLLVGSFVLAAAMVKTKLAERITYMILLKIGSSTRNITFGVMVANICLAFLVPSSTARTAILLPVCLSIIHILKGDEQGRSNFAINLLLTLAFTNATISAGIMTATVPNPVTVDFIIKAGGPAIGYMDWLIYGFPPALLMTLATWWLIQIIFKPEKAELTGGIAFVHEQIQKLGVMSQAEWRTAAVFVLIVAAWATGSMTKIDATVACLAGIVLFFLPRFGVLNWNDANKSISWQVVLICGGGISLGDILMKTGAAKWLAVTIFHFMGLQGASTIVILVLVMLVIQYMHLVFVGTTAMATALLPIALGMAQTANINPAVLALPVGMIVGGYPLLMFYNTLPNILIYGTGELKIGDFPKIGVAICTLACLVYSLCAITYWRWLGMF